jgi:hypothetical protein
MQKRTMITLGSAIAGALLTSALVAGVAFATAPATAPEKSAAVSVAAPESEKAGPAETDGIDHQFEGQETGNNGDGVEDTSGSTD